MSKKGLELRGKLRIAIAWIDHRRKETVRLLDRAEKMLLEFPPMSRGIRAKLEKFARADICIEAIASYRTHLRVLHRQAEAIVRKLISADVQDLLALVTAIARLDSLDPSVSLMSVLPRRPKNVALPNLPREMEFYHGTPAPSPAEVARVFLNYERNWPESWCRTVLATNPDLEAEVTRLRTPVVPDV
jgi:hypothetical protein